VAVPEPGLYSLGGKAWNATTLAGSFLQPP